MKSYHYDVVVSGGGIAGCAAAIAAARQGQKTVLIEKQSLLGGLATSGLIYIYLPLCDGYGHQVTYGIAEELLQRCTAYGPFDVPAAWGGPVAGRSGCAADRFQCCFSPAGFTLVLDQMLSEAGVELWLDSTVIGVQCDEQHAVRALTVFNGAQQYEITGNCFVDATGGAYLVQLAQGAVSWGENYVTPWVLEMSDCPEVYHFSESLHVKFIGVPGTPGVPRRMQIATAAEETEFIRQAWQAVRQRYDAVPEAQKKSTYPVHLPAMAQIRKIARIDARYNLSDRDCGQKFADAIGRVGDWRCPAPVWEAPYGALVPRTVKNLLAAGRCIGAMDNAWEVFRVIPAAALTGEAAGIAASLCAQRQCDPAELPIAVLQQELPDRREH